MPNRQKIAPQCCFFYSSPLGFCRETEHNYSRVPTLPRVAPSMRKLIYTTLRCDFLAIWHVNLNTIITIDSPVSKIISISISEFSSIMSHSHNNKCLVSVSTSWTRTLPKANGSMKAGIAVIKPQVLPFPQVPIYHGRDLALHCHSARKCAEVFLIMSIILFRFPIRVLTRYIVSSTLISQGGV